MLDRTRQRLASMSRTRLIVAPLLVILIAYLLSIPFQHKTSSSSSSSPFPPKEEYTYPAPEVSHTRPKRVAVVGAGASGSAAAWFLRRAGRVVEARSGLSEGDILGEVVVFDKEGYIGGRTTTVFPHGDERLRPVELGASIFIEANRHLYKAAKHFGLETGDPDFGESGLGIWDGHEFLFTTSESSSYWAGWWDTLSAIRRYGFMSPYRSKNAVKALLDRFANLYNPSWLASQGAASSIESFTERVGLGKEMTTRWAGEYARKVLSLGDRWINEIMEGSTRVNYAADMDGIHALAASVSMAASGAMAVQGGNWRIFDAMLQEANVTLHLATEVSDIIPLDAVDGSPQFHVKSNRSNIDDSQPFDLVFFAAPWHSSPISKSLQTHFHEPIPKQRYVRLHVTLFTTTRESPLPLFFGLPSTTSIPSTVLTVRPVAGGPPPRFQSITWHGETGPGTGEHVVKIFSLTRFSDKLIRELIGQDPTWLLRKEWDSYPSMTTVASYAPVEPLPGVQYLAALEPWVSTMETQTLSAREAVARVVKDWWDLGFGECKGGADAWDWSCDQ
ncbi:Prenylcysteine lyase-domain-containing protein [Naematelia encephala]|uniref:Prenylcysteine lyase-domain-containing protein n=1 Tax=Naematelia encephala TaxID=71784 RepID=A0A1Y2ARL0_9TREE|nr:Prenylcysteine lyase-domain-containing protein [Naematelia encephala]